MNGVEMITVNNITWHPRNADDPILDEVSGVFAEGRFCVLLGPNGAGKTTLLKMIMGFKQPDSGEIKLGNECLREYSRRDLAEVVAYLPQISESRYELPVIEVIRMARYSRLKPFQDAGPEDHAAVDRAVELSGCADLCNLNFSHLSGGERQRVLFARALAQESRFILLDEPVSNLDLRYQHTILATLKKLSGEHGVGIICVMHDINLAKQYANEVYLMKKGRLVKQGPLNDVLQPELLSSVYDWELEEIISPQSEESFFISKAGTV